MPHSREQRGSQKRKAHSVQGKHRVKENIALVLKYFDQLVPIMQEQDSKLRPAD
jgi:hypothetical protein